MQPETWVPHMAMALDYIGLGGTIAYVSLGNNYLHGDTHHDKIQYFCVNPEGTRSLTIRMTKVNVMEMTKLLWECTEGRSEGLGYWGY